MSDAPERIWMPPLWEVGDGIIPTDGQCEDDDIYYLRSDLHEAAVAAARAEAEKWQMAFAAQSRKLQAALDIGGDAVRRAVWDASK